MWQTLWHAKILSNIFCNHWCVLSKRCLNNLVIVLLTAKAKQHPCLIKNCLTVPLQHNDLTQDGAQMSYTIEIIRRAFVIRVVRCS